MTPADVEHPTTVLRSREELIRDRDRRQTHIFLAALALVMLIGLVALGSWREWWTIGGPAEAAATCPAQMFIDPQLTNVTVINGTDRKGLATGVARELQKRKFRVLAINSEEQDRPIKAVVQVRYGVAGAQAARTVARQFPAKVTMIRDSRDSEAVDVVLGEKYTSMIGASKAAAAIKQKPPPRGCVQPTTGPSTASNPA